MQNLVGVTLEQITPAKETIKRLLEGAGRHIADAKVQAISAETRFGSAYTAIRMLADVGWHAHGYRTSTSKPRHHQTAIQTLPAFKADCQGWADQYVTADESGLRLCCTIDQCSPIGAIWIEIRPERG